MNLSGPSTDYQSAFSALKTPIFSDNVQDLLGTGTFHTNPGAIITVNSIADIVDGNDGVTTLREAINQANADNGEDLIVFDRSLFSTAQTITLSLGELDITHNVDIIAPRDTLTGGDLVTVSGNKTSRVFEIEKGATVSLNGLIVADGKATNDNGGGIKNSGTLTLDSSIVRNNSGRIDSDFLSGDGGGIFNDGNLTLSNSTISGNTLSFGFAGGIYNSTGTVSVNNSTISGNTLSFGVGGGIYNGTGTVSVNNSTISGNTSSYGGGIYNSAGTVSVNNSTINGNTLSFGSGGGIYNGSSATLTLVSSTVTQNQAANGGGLFNGTAASFQTPGTVNVRNTIIASNVNSDNGINPDVFGNFTSLGYNLIGNSTGSTGFDATGDIVGTSDNPIDPRLAPLDFYGGPTQTIALFPDSPAIDAGDPTVLDTDPTTDQRGFPRVSNGRVDIGAFEFSA